MRHAPLSSPSQQTALVTGASTGIGRAFAEELSRRGHDLIVVARSADALEALASELRTRNGRQVHVIPLDLSQPDAPENLYHAITELGVQVDILVNNAGFGSHGDLVLTAPEILAGQVQLNATALVVLTRLFLPPMLKRGSGIVINIASNGAYQPLPHMAVYGATKAFVLSFTRALWSETRGTGVRVLALSPGPTQTAFFDRAGEGAGPKSRRTPEQVVQTALRSLRRTGPSVIDGTVNTIVARLATLMPERVSIALAEHTLRNNSAGEI